MMSRPIISILPNGWKVPYPNEVNFYDLLWLKDYRLNDYPKDAQGIFIDDESYFEWLADYLCRCEIDLTESPLFMMNTHPPCTNEGGYLR
jgi:hypothetical protein